MSTEDGHDHHHPRPDSQVALRARALEALLAEKGLVAADAIDAVVELYERDVGPQNGARVVSRAWTDPAFRERLLEDGTKAIAELGFGGFEADTLAAVANTPTVHNVVVCTLCSCYPWPVLGLPPTWYKSPPYRARRWAEPRAVLREFGLGAARRGRDLGLGFQRRGPLSGRADAARRHRWADRGGPECAGHPRLHDRHGRAAGGVAVSAGAGPRLGGGGRRARRACGAAA